MDTSWLKFIMSFLNSITVQVSILSMPLVIDSDQIAFLNRGNVQIRNLTLGEVFGLPLDCVCVSSVMYSQMYDVIAKL